MTTAYLGVSQVLAADDATAHTNTCCEPALCG
jgi:hypothetical protein